ncbi:MAG: alanine--tRNA ligase [Caldilineaceae bacterium SB0662_bin_9]|uniref:Alanine--tRNA ligase n=1 Tax=Caldilineaceae bacterium SB0662_bin_9 TaxID=2605258 RepID=A0A6B1DWM1_9CHLR|nr:alanine--tRNA ligase [Caldilineaceae bacterium SB0662_bin_9]
MPAVNQSVVPPDTIGVNQIRKQYLDFFAERGHRPVTSSNLVPDNDDTLMFVNAGMVQFKEALLGVEARPYRRAVTSQKCLRVSGKHNDLDEVGPSPRHHTFFEMLGNFSFGDYFKEDAVKFAWELVTEVWQLPVERLWFSIYEDDDEAEELWRAVGAAPDRIRRFGRSENWWSMGDTGPCGPCSELHYYWGDLDQQHADGVNRDDEYLEFWNLVFMQYDQKTPTERVPLANPGVDTGCGLERIASILQGVETTYDTDVFRFLMDRIQQLAGASDQQRQDSYVPFRVLADHSRAVTFLISDGVLPGNEGRNYITRLILRRAARFGRMLGFQKPFLAHMVESVVEEMGDHFTEIRDRQSFICDTVTAEEERFLRTLENGLGHLENIVADARDAGRTEISGAQSFLLWDTFGFPLDLTRDIAREQGLAVDEEEYRKLAADARERSRARAKFMDGGDHAGYRDLKTRLTEAGSLPPEGVVHLIYEPAPHPATTVLALLQDDEPAVSVNEGERVEVITAATPFYMESGGQVSDTGRIRSSDHTSWEIVVDDIQRPVSGLLVHRGTVRRGSPTAGDAAVCEVDQTRRRRIERNHTATHLLHAALRAVLGESVHQAGSLVAPDRLRFDFTLPRGMSPEEVDQVEQMVRSVVLADAPIKLSWESHAEAVAGGAMALFGEKYEDTVRVVRIAADGFESQELCGGMHLDRTAAVGPFYIVSEASSAAGQRRVEAVTGEAANAWVRSVLERTHQTADALKTQPHQIVEAAEALSRRVQELRRELEQARRQSALDDIDQLAQTSIVLGEVPCVFGQVPNRDGDTLREMCDHLQHRLGDSVIALGSATDGRPLLVVAVSRGLSQRGLHAGAMVKQAASAIAGGGGGRQNMAQAGGRDPAGLSQALDMIAEAVREHTAA